MDQNRNHNQCQKFAEVIRDALDRVNHAEHAHLITEIEAERWQSSIEAQ